MTASARTVLYFGLYLCGLGAGLLAAPHLVLAPFGLPAPQDVWVRISGMLVLILGVHDILAARLGLRAYVKWSVPRRASVMLVFAGLVASGQAPAVMLLFGAVDLAAAAWTWRTLQHEAT